MLRIGVDTGGTFTDFVIASESAARLFKLPSTPAKPAEALREGVRSVDVDEFELTHGTTVATNAILERTLARTAFVTNKGFEHLLFLGRQTRPALYEFEPTAPTLPLTRCDCFGLPGRLLPDGKELEPINGAALADIAKTVRDYEAVAVCLLFAYANPAHERLVGSALTNHFISLSHEVSPEFREYERAMATFLNAALMPRMQTYLEELAAIKGAAEVNVMASSGGLIPLAAASQLPLHTVTSGPAAGVMAAQRLATSLGRSRVLAFDMGGTSTDVALIDGAPAMTSFGEIGGLQVRLNRLDVKSIGCGGGSIVWTDTAGALRVGPQSAGADPGPALYGKSGLLTVTDANFALGRLPVTSLAGGVASDISPANSRAVLLSVAQRLDTDPTNLAEAIVTIAEAQMAGAIRAVSAARGKDPADFCLVAYGGAAGAHACAIAELLGIEEVLFPPAPGVFSAYGLLCAPHIVERTTALLGCALNPAQVFAEMEEEARPKLKAQNFRTIRVADLRFRGQSHELQVPVEPGEPAAATEERFRRLHQERYGVIQPAASIEWVCARVRVESEPMFVPPQPSSKPVPIPAKKTILLWQGKQMSAHLHSRSTIPPKIVGPAIILQTDTTIVLPPQWLAMTAPGGTLIASRD